MPAAASPELERAIEVFARGFSYVRSRTHPYEATPNAVPGFPDAPPLWVLRDAERRRGNYRTEEWLSCNLPPAVVDAAARADTRGRFVICAIHPAGSSDQPLRDGFRALGYRLNTTEPLMMHPLRRIPRVAAPAEIGRVLTPEMADRLHQATHNRQIRPEDLHPGARQRQYVAFVDDTVVGWVGSIVVNGATWCQNMFVVEQYRRRGIARAMLCRMLRDDRAHGAEMAVLTASHTGARLYPLVGYRQIGLLLAYTPKRRATVRA
ncbi:MAG: GNAT family N-acetyltransferase [Spirochaetaceae bacterium]|nr:GNAT family N-acetyltransferase [Spirochaetaceae bacterium]